MLNLVSATLVSYDTIIESAKRNPTDFAVMSYYIKKCNDAAWINTDVVTTLTRLNGVTGSRANHVKSSLKRLQELDLVQVTRRSANLSKPLTSGEKICLKAGSKLQQLNTFKTTTTIKTTKSTKRSGGEAS